MREEQPCKVACRANLDPESAKNFKEKIDDEYRVNMILDNLPVAVLRQRRDGNQLTTYDHGFRVGFKGNYARIKEEKYFINNHLSFRVMYHKDSETDSARIVGFEVTPSSINHEYKEWDEKNPQLTTCNQNTKNIIQGSAVPQEVDTNKEVVFTYDVSFKESDVKWASRWDTYLLMNDDQIHWFSIINSLMIVLFLSGMVAMIMMRTLYRDIANYNQLETQDEAQEETGWKLLHGDVFRAPINSGLLCVYVGTGVQIFGMTLVTMKFAVLGFLSPSNRGGLMTAMVLFYLGFKKAAIEDPVKTNQDTKVDTRAGMFYYIFGFLFIVFVILLITCAEITIVLCYFQLCSEDYHWWWRAYLIAGSSALYLFLYSIFYFFTKLEITKLVSGILYFGYMLIGSYAFFVLTGTIGFYACFWFVRKIYYSVKID
ncbi:transmembrane nine 7 [Actinidia rufa]|uniref:Transmembrane 9 superfamily member n=1 Tax=Actinidia rufa TaxID=165716 RepID=A0A7J0G0J1_9ERIC|nr:transmembrane nine 7 [Actinidia rufa]